MTDPKTRRTKTGRDLTDAEIHDIAHEVETATYDIDALKTRGRGRPTIGAGPAEVVPVRLDHDLRDAVEARAEQEHTTTSEVIRRALRRFLEVA